MGHNLDLGYLDCCSQIYSDGKKAFEMGDQTVNNPYKYGTAEYHAWDDGYEAAKSELYGE
jgi:hypothetical protein